MNIDLLLLNIGGFDIFIDPYKAIDDIVIETLGQGLLDPIPSRGFMKL